MKDAAHAPAADESATRGVPPPPGPPWAGAPPTGAQHRNRSAQHTRGSLSHTRRLLSAARCGTRTRPQRSIAERIREADEDPEVRGHVDVAHVVEAQHLLAVTCAQQIIA